MTVEPSTLKEVADLPTFDALNSDRWGPAGFDSLLGELFAAGFEGPIRSPFDGSLLAFRNADVRALGADPRVGGSPISGNIPRTEEDEAGSDDEPESASYALFKHHVFTLNPPHHRPMSQLFSRHFMPNKMAAYKPLAEAAIQRALREAADRGEIDFQRGLAYPAGAYFLGALYGYEESEIQRMIEVAPDQTSMSKFETTKEEDELLSVRLFEYLDLAPKVFRRSLASSNPPEYLVEMAAEFEKVAPEHRPAHLAHMDLPLFLATLAAGGEQVLPASLTDIMAVLLDEPDAWSEVREDPALALHAVREAMRLTTPAEQTSRMALEDFEYDGVFIPASTMITLFWLAGNRDPEAFVDPDRFDLHRKRAGHVTWGGGAHMCPGRDLTTMFLTTCIEELTKAEYRITAVGPNDKWISRAVFWGIEELRVVIETS